MKLTVSLAQMKVAQAKTGENLRNGERLIAEAAARGSDIVAFPEMWTTGFNWAHNTAAAREAPAVIERVREMAKRYRIWVAGSMLAPSRDGRPANAAFLFDASGAEAARYDKIHLFSAIRENDHVVPGAGPLRVADTPWGKVGLAICYDIRFPELFRSYALQGARIVFTSAAFPYPKLHHWKTLLRARAIENQFYVVAVNQVGAEDLGESGIHTYVGSSAVIDPWGETAIEAGEAEEVLATVAIGLDTVDEVRKKMDTVRDRRPDLYRSE